MGPENAADKDIRSLIGELHKHMRHNMLLWVQWFTFFVTVNYVAFGWFAGSASNGQNHHVVMLASCLFVSQCSLGIWASLHLASWFKSSDRELFRLYQELNAQTKEPAFSVQFYRLSIFLGSAALFGIICAWIALEMFAHLNYL